jgi:hypothetical protein
MPVPTQTAFAPEAFENDAFQIGIPVPPPTPTGPPVVGGSAGGAKGGNVGQKKKKRWDTEAWRKIIPRVRAFAKVRSAGTYPGVGSVSFRGDKRVTVVAKPVVVPEPEPIRQLAVVSFNSVGCRTGAASVRLWVQRQVSVKCVGFGCAVSGGRVGLRGLRSGRLRLASTRLVDSVSRVRMFDALEISDVVEARRFLAEHERTMASLRAQEEFAIIEGRMDDLVRIDEIIRNAKVSVPQNSRRFRILVQKEVDRLLSPV